jgi:16S rRNA (guanine(966)-N(2))-methyltransferase RsmD
MKIISGTLRGRNLKAPRGLTTRPVLSGVREALFNVLGGMDGARVLDLFAGTGAIGIEALSRGAKSAVFVDSGAEQCAVIRDNLDALGVQGEVIRSDVPRALERFAKTGRTFDFIFADPPYEQGLSQAALEFVCGRGLLSPHGVMAVTVRKSEDLPGQTGTCERIFDRRYGDTRLAIYGERKKTGDRSQETE